MSQPMVVVKKYGNRRLYDTESSRYITLDDMAGLLRSGRDVRVIDAKTKADLTKSVLLQIITEQEKEHDLLPISFLKKVIRHGDATLRESMRRYLSVSLDAFLDAQKDFEQRYRTFAGSLVNPMMWMVPPGQRGAPAPFRPGEVPPGPPRTEDLADESPGVDLPGEPYPVQPPPMEAPVEEAPQDPATNDQIRMLKEQMAQMQEMIAKLAK